MSDRTRELRFQLAGAAGARLIQSLLLTTGVERTGQENFLRFRRWRHPVIFVFWHGQLLPLLYYHRKEGVVVLVSEHADGEYVTRVMHRMGFGTVRGSSTRGATKGLRGLIRAARQGLDLALTPDGPSGPARSFKPGALLAAAITGLPIIPVAASASAAWTLRSWDGFLVPKPFARVRLRYGPPHWVERTAGDEALASHARVLERTLNELSDSVAREERRPMLRVESRR
jgi:lysophospholipid acyltransferase (LPLAT)-like uncharacterized protein